jgi:hypothetical protein
MNATAPPPLRETTVEAASFDDRVGDFDERRAYVERVVRHRCPELTGAEIGDATANWRFTGEDGAMSNLTSNTPTVMIPPEMARHVLDALSAITERMDRIEGHMLRSEAEGRA